MTEAIETAVSEIVTVLRSVLDANSVPVNPPEQMSKDTFAVVYPERGSVDVSPIGTRESLHAISIFLLTVRSDLARDIARVKPYIDTISNALLSEMTYDSDGNQGGIFNNSIDTFGSLTYQQVSTDYGGVPVIGYQFTMEDVKIKVNL